MTVEKVRYLDRRLTESSSGVSASYDSGTDTTTWTLPYSVATDGSEGTLVVCRRDASPTVYSTTRPATNQVAVQGEGDLSGVEVFIGLTYELSIDLSPILLRDQHGRVDDRGRLTLRYLDIRYHETTDLKATVSSDGRADVDHVLDASSPEDGSLHIPVMARNTLVGLTLTNNTPGGCALTSLEWEANLIQRSRRR